MMNDVVLQNTRAVSATQDFSGSEWATILVDQDGLIQKYCPLISTLWDDTEEKLIGKPLRTVMPRIPIRPQTPGFNRAFTTFWQNQHGLRQPVQVRRDGLVSEVETKLCSVPPSRDTEPPMILVGLRFPTGLLECSKDLDRLKKKAENSSKAIMVTDQGGLITYVNPTFERLSGYSRHDAIGKPASLLKSGLHEVSFYARLWETLKNGQEFHAVFANRRRNGEIFFEEKRIRPYVDPNDESRHFVAISHLVSDSLQATLLRLERLANHDPLTGLPNRNLFLDRLEQHFSRATRHGNGFAMAYIDLDNFKEINDTYGHAAGDLVLQTTGYRIKDALREEDTVGRLGGDEFGLLLSDIHEEADMVRIVEKIMEALARGVDYEGVRLDIAASIGIACYPEGGNDPASMLRNADSAMYRCKLSGGKGYRVYHDTHRHEARGNQTEIRPKPDRPEWNSV